MALIDARSDDPRVREVQAAGYDPHAGMVVRHADRTYHGADAMRVLAFLSRPGLRGGPMRLPFANSGAVGKTYGLFSLGRRMVLRCSVGPPFLRVDRASEPLPT